MKFNRKRIFSALAVLAVCVMCIAIPTKAVAAPYNDLSVSKLTIESGRTPGIVTDTYHLHGSAKDPYGINRIEVTLYRQQDTNGYAVYRRGTVSFNNAVQVTFQQSPQLSHLLSQNMWGDYIAVLRIFNARGNSSQTAIKYTVEKSLGSYMAGLYREFLRRDPELKGYVDNMQMVSFRRINIAGMVKGFYYSPEYKSKSRPSNEAFVRSLYRGILGRTPDTEGFNNYVRALNNGANRDRIVNDFLASQEFNNTVIREFQMQYYK